MFPHYVGSRFLVKMVSWTFLEWIPLVTETRVEVFLKLTLSWKVLRVCDSGLAQMDPLL